MNAVGGFCKKLWIAAHRRSFHGELDEEMAFHREQAERNFVRRG